MMLKITNAKLRTWLTEEWDDILVRCKPTEQSLRKITKRFTKKEVEIPPLNTNNQFIYKTDDKVEALTK